MVALGMVRNVQISTAMTAVNWENNSKEESFVSLVDIEPGKKRTFSATRNQAEAMNQLNIPTGESTMPLVNVVLVLIVAGVLMWLVNRYIPMQGTIKGILNAVVVIVVVIWLLNVFGLMGTISLFRVGH